MLRKCLLLALFLFARHLIGQDSLRLELTSTYESYKKSQFLDSSQFNRIVHVGEAILERRPADSLASMYLHLAYYNHAVSLLKVVDESLVNREFMDRQKEAMAYLEKSKEYYLLFKKAPR